MTPNDLARNLAASDDPADRALGVAIIARGLADDTEERAGWPMVTAIPAAMRYLGIEGVQTRLALDAARLAPTISDAMLNKAAR